MRKILLFAMLLVSTSIFSQIPESLEVTLPWELIYVEDYDANVGAIPTTTNPSVEIQEPGLAYYSENGEVTKKVLSYIILDLDSGVPYDFTQVIRVNEMFKIQTVTEVTLTFDELPYQITASDLIVDAEPNHSYSFDPNDELEIVVNYDESYLEKGSYSLFVYDHDDRSVAEVLVNIEDCEDYAEVDIPTTATVEFNGESVVELTAELLDIDIFNPCAAEYDLKLRHGAFENEVYPSSIGEVIDVEVVFNGDVQAQHVLVSVIGEGHATVSMYIEEKTFSAGEEFTLDVWSDQLDGLVAWQFRLNFQDAKIIDITEGPPFDNIPHNIFNDDQTINSLWTPADTEPIDVPSNATWFMLKILPSVDGSTIDIFTAENDLWSAIFVDDGVTISGFDVDFSFNIEERGFLVSNEEAEEDNLIIHNNPVSDRLILSGYNDNIDISKLSIFALDGRQIMSKSIDFNNEQLELDVSSLKSGIYFLNLNGNSSQTIRFVKI